MSRTFVIGDIHGAHRALLQCLERAAFDRHNDTLICLGDVADGWPETKEAIDELLTIRKLIYIMGNHDFWTLQWLETNSPDEAWLMQGGLATLKSFQDIPRDRYITFFRNAKRYYIYNNCVFVHAGFDPNTAIETQASSILYWDRNLARMAQDFAARNISISFSSYDAIYLGHTPVANAPVKVCNVWLLDSGAGWNGRLSMMNIETKEVFQSDSVPELYPGVKGRKKF